jgi:hypothetical protein
MLKNKRIEKNYRRNSSLKMVVAGVGGPAGVPIEIAHIASLSLNRYPATPPSTKPVALCSVLHSQPSSKNLPALKHPLCVKTSFPKKIYVKFRTYGLGPLFSGP